MNIEKADAVTKCRGAVIITMREDATGKEVVYRTDNQVVNGLYGQLAYLLSGDITNRQITQIMLGKGVVAPTEADTTITVLASPVTLSTTATNPTVKSVQFEATWGSSEVNAEAVTELGLFHANGTLAARIVFPAMNKSAGWTWTIAWRLTYA